MAYRFKWEHRRGFAECHEGYVEQEEPENWWLAFMNYTNSEGEYRCRELGTFLTKREAMDRVEGKFEQVPGPPCKVLVKDGHPVVEAIVARNELTEVGSPVPQSVESRTMVRSC